MLETPDDVLDRLKNIEDYISQGNIPGCIVDISLCADECAQLLGDDIVKVVEMIGVLSPVICALLSSLGYLKSPSSDIESGRVISELMIVAFMISSAMGKSLRKDQGEDLEECMNFLSGISNGMSLEDLKDSLGKEDSND